MIIKYEKLEDTEELDEKGKKIKAFKEVSKATATHKHICGHDTNPPTPCKREKL